MTLKIITLNDAKTIVGRGKTFSTADLTKIADIDALAKLLKEQPTPFKIVVVK